MNLNTQKRKTDIDTFSSQYHHDAHFLSKKYLRCTSFGIQGHFPPKYIFFFVATFVAGNFDEL